MKKKVIAIIMAIFAFPLALAGGTFLSFANSDNSCGGGISSSQSTTYDADVIESHNVDPSENQLQYNSDLGYFYFVDGKYPQSYVGNTLNTTLNEQFNANDTGDYYLTVGGVKSPVFTYDSNEYLAFEPSQTVTVNLDGANVTFSSGSTYFFAVEPIVWRVSDYGVSETQCPIDAPDMRTGDLTFKAVSDLVLDWGAVETGDTTEGWAYTSSDMYANINSNYTVLSGQSEDYLIDSSFLYSGTMNFDFDSFSARGKQNPVTTTNTSTSGIFQASLSDLSANLSDYRAYASDFVCMLAGVSDTQWCTYATRDLQNLGSGYYIGVDGRAHTRWLDTNSAVRMSTSYLLKRNFATLITGQNLAMVIKNSTSYDTSDTTVTTIVFDKYTAEGEYMVGGINVISGLTGIDVSLEGDGSIMLYRSTDRKTVYILSGVKIFANPDASYMFCYCSGLTSITFNNFSTSKVTDMAFMFRFCSGLAELDLSSFDTSNVVNMSFMFSTCESLTELDLSPLNTSKVTDMRDMFFRCSGLTELDLSPLDTSKVTDMQGMFFRCEDLTELDLSPLNTSNVTDMNYMFSTCESLTELDLSPLDTSKVTDMTDMFYGCSSLTELDLSGFDTSNVIGMSYMFYGCSGLTELDLSPLDTSKVTDMSNMFYGCSGLTELDLSGFDTSNVTDMSWMFFDCSSLTELDLSGFDTSNVTNMDTMFDSCTSLTTIYVSGSWSTSKVPYFSYMFYGCTKLVGGNGTTYNANYTDKTYARIDTASTPGYLTKSPAMLISGQNLAMAIKNSTSYDTSDTTVTTIVFDKYTAEGEYMVGGINVISGLTGIDVSLEGDGSIMLYRSTDRKTVYILSGVKILANPDSSIMFIYCQGLTSITFKNFSTSKVTTMRYMFGYCSKLTSLNLSSFDTSKVTDMSYMFRSCSSLTELDLSGFDTSKVTTMRYMFDQCSNLTSLDLSSFDTSKVTNMSSMFSGCSKLTSLDLSSLDTSNVTSMSSMFYNCSVLTELHLSSIDTSNVTTMQQMFNGCKGLKELDISGWDISKVTSMSYMFYGCSSLTTIYVSDSWSTAKVTSSSYMFTACTSLVGGNGTTYNANYMDKTYARIDTANTPGYLTIPAMLISGQNLAMAIKNSTSYDTSDTTVTTIVFDKYTSNGQYLVNGTNVISGLTGKDVSETGDGSIMLYRNSAGTTVYILSGVKILANPDSSIMFNYCQGLTSITFKNFSTSKVTTMRYMFGYCSKLTSLDLSSFDTSKVTDMSYMFRSCSSLTELDLSGFDTSNVTTMRYMFYQCSNLTSLDLSNWNTANVELMDYLFSGCSKLTSLDLSSLDTSNVTSMSRMFYSCSVLTTIYVSDSWSTTKVTNSSYMFTTCTSLVGENGTTYNANYTDKTYARIDTASTPGYLTKMLGPAMLKSGQDMAMLIKNATSYSTSNSTITSIIFDYVKYYNVSTLGTGVDASLNNDGSAMIYGAGTSTVYVLSKSKMFVTDPSYMFYNMRAVTNITFNNFNTSLATTMYNMFSYCGYFATNLSLDLSGFDTSNVTNMRYMFSYCYSLTSLDLSGFDTSNVTDMSDMFEYCSSLTSLDLSSFDTSKVADMSDMFMYCSSLTSLDLSSFDTSKVTDMSGMFYSCSALTTIYVSDSWRTANVTSSSSMFSGCKSLVGGNGTKYNSSYVNITYARIDTASTPGYLTKAIAYLKSGQDMAMLIKNATSYSTSNSTITSIIFDYVKNYNVSTLGTGVDASLNNDGSAMIYGAGTSTVYVLSKSKMFVTDPSYMFQYMYAVTNITFNNFNTSLATTMYGMFYYCGYSATNLSLDLSGWDTSNVTIMRYMFYNCKGLTELDLSGFDTSNVTSMSYMFYGCSALTTIYVSDSWRTANVTSSSSMFSGCTKLKGKISFNSSYIDKTYANYTNGYLTYKAKASSVNEDERAQKMTITTKIVWAVCGTVFAVVAGVFVWLIVLRRCRNSIAKRDILKKIK